MQLSLPVVQGGIGLAIALDVSPLVPASPLPVSKLERPSGRVTQPPLQPVTRLASPADLDGVRMVSLTFPRALPIRDVLLLLVRDTPFSTVVDASVDTTFAGELRDLTLRQALEAVLFPSGLDYEVRRTVIRVFPKRPKTRLFQLDFLAVRRSWQSRTAAPGTILSSVDSDIFSEIDRGVAALLSSSGRHHVDRRAGLVQVTDFADRLDLVGVYLEAVQLRATRQIRLDVRIYRFTPAATPGDPPRVSTVAADPGELIGALARAGRLEPVASRTLLTMNNEPVFAPLDVGNLASVAVTPQASADGFVQLSVVPRFLSDPAAGDSGADAPVRPPDGDTIVRVRDGETVMMAGFTAGASQPGEWVVLVTPRIVDLRANPGASWRTP